MTRAKKTEEEKQATKANRRSLATKRRYWGRREENLARCRQQLEPFGVTITKNDWINQPTASKVRTPRKKCELRFCDGKAVYGTPGTRSVRFCRNHKQPGMSIGGKARKKRPPAKKTHPVKKKEPKVVKKRNVNCIFCDKKAVYGFAGDKYPSMCKEHKLTGMSYGARKLKERKTPAKKKAPPKAGNKCDLCSSKATYGFPGSRVAMCKTHKLDGMTWYARAKKDPKPKAAKKKKTVKKFSKQVMMDARAQMQKAREKKYRKKRGHDLAMHEAKEYFKRDPYFTGLDMATGNRTFDI